ncbi:hypothetical protein ES708_14926 [subsurface metagenome]
MLAGFSCRFCVSYIVNHLDGLLGFFQAKTVSIKDMPVGLGMQIGKSIAEFDLFTVNGYAAVGTRSVPFNVLGEVVVINAQVPSHPGPFQLKITGGFVVFQEVGYIFTDIPEDPYQHIEKMDADVGGDTAGFLKIAFP